MREVLQLPVSPNVQLNFLNYRKTTPLTQYFGNQYQKKDKTILFILTSWLLLLLLITFINLRKCYKNLVNIT